MTSLLINWTRLACGIAEADDAEARGDIAGELLFPAALHLRLDRHRLERLDAGDALDQKSLVLGAAREFLVEPLAKQRRRDQPRCRCRTERTPSTIAGQQRRIDRTSPPERRR